MSITQKDANAINTLLEVLFDLPDVNMDFWRVQRTPGRVREAAIHLAERAHKQLQCGVRPDQLETAPLRVRT